MVIHPSSLAQRKIFTFADRR